jgi:hypothetical protein
MKILPPQTNPPSEKIDRRHSPKPAGGRYGYREYRPCLRWDFGFTCAFCLLHEADLSEHGTEATGLTSVEHFVPVSHEGAINDYQNCFYACRFCNQARADAPVIDSRGRRLLNPCDNVWAQHFRLTDSCLTPVSDEAGYTHEIYDLDDPRKIERRKFRRERLQEWRQLLSEGPAVLEGLMSRLLTGPVENQIDILKAADLLRQAIGNALRDIRRYAAVPGDADEACRCESGDHCSLPDVYSRQTSDLPP